MSGAPLPRAELGTAVSAAALSTSLMVSILGSWSTFRDTPDLTGSQTAALRTAALAGAVVVVALAVAGGGTSTLVVGLGAVAAVTTAYGTAYAESGP